MKRALLLLAPLALGGCMVDTIAKTAVGIVTLPVKVASAGVDAVTTSQTEADQKRGREIRQREERVGKLQRERDRYEKDCLKGDRGACDRVSAINAEMQLLLPQLPADPRD
jgi:hypothetical protein